MKKLYRERLLKVAELLENLKQTRKEIVDPEIKKFDMSEWTCGTSACAAGWAALHPWFIKRGFHIYKYQYETYEEFHPRFPRRRALGERSTLLLY